MGRAIMLPAATCYSNFANDYGDNQTKHERIAAKSSKHHDADSAYSDIAPETLGSRIGGYSCQTPGGRADFALTAPAWEVLRKP